MKRKVIAASLALVLAGGAAYAVASSDGCREGRGIWGKDNHSKYEKHSGGKGMMSARMLEKLDWELELSGEQRDQIRSLMKDKYDAKGDQRQQMKDLRQSMKDLDPASPGYKSEVSKLADQQADAVRQRVLDHAGTYADIYGILTPEQQQEFKELKEKWSSARGKRSGGWN